MASKVIQDRLDDIKFLLKNVYEYRCYESFEEFKMSEENPEEFAILHEGMWLIFNTSAKVFNPFTSLSDTQSLLVHIFFNRPVLKKEQPIITKKQLADKIFQEDKDTFSKEETLTFMFTVSSSVITDAVVALLKDGNSE